jgi:hypothetical protein
MARRVVLRLFPTSSPVALLRLCALAVLCLGVASVLPTVASAAGSGPVAEYSFDEDKGEAIEDLAGENDGTVEGAKWTANGRYGGAMEYLGYESCVKVPDSPQLRGGEEFTLEAWVRPTTVHEFMPIFYKQRGEDYAYGLWFDEVADGKPEGEINDGTYPLPTVKAEADVPLDAWSHVALTFDGAHMRLYVDGRLVATGATAEPLASEGPLEIGCASVYGNEDHFEGRIDEARIYDRALTEAEVDLDMETPLQTPKAGPVAAWSFDEGKGTTATDLTGHGHTATISKATWTRGRFGGGLKFDGKTSCVSVASSSELDFTEEFTLETWVRPEGLGLHSVIAQEDESAAPGEDPFAYTLLSGDEEEEGPRIWVRHPGGARGIAGGPPLPQDAWSHLAVTDDGAYLRFYVNGELTDTRPAVPLTTGNGPLTIGCMPIYGDFFKGRVDEVRLYGRTLTNAEVDSDMEAPVQTPKTGPVADYSFDEGSGETAEDLTGNGHTATLQGAEWTPHGRYGGALEFKSANEDFVSIPASTSLDGTEELTVEAWVRPTAAPAGYGSILAKEREGSGPLYSYALLQRKERPIGYFMEKEEPEYGDGGAEGSLPQGTWTHLAITDDGAYSRLYVNGELVDTELAVPIEGHGEIRLGGDSMWGDWFSGRIDEVRIYDRGLDAAEVDADMETPLATPKAGPVADYSFDEKNEETQADTSGNGHTATVEGAKWTENGRYGGAMEFDGENDCLSIPATAELQATEEFSVEAWVRPEGSGERPLPVIAMDDENSGPGEEEFSYILFGGQNAAPEGWVRKPGESGTWDVWGEEPLPEKAWSHLTLTDDGHLIRLYVNGKMVSDDTAPPLTSAEGPLNIGCGIEYGPWRYFKGRIDEVRVYNRAINDAEVAADMAAPIQTPQQGPIAAWSFDEIEEGGTAEDITGNGHTATIEGATLARGKYGNALQFNGESDVVKVPSSPEFALTEGFTIESWVRPESESNEWAPILAKNPGSEEAGGGGPAWWLYEGDWNSNEPYGGTEPTPGTRSEAVSEKPLPVSAWSHVALTYDGAKLRLYVNGELIDCSPTPAGAPRVTAGELQIGGPNGYGNFFRGRLDEVRIYNRALNAAEVTASMLRLPGVGTAEPYGVEGTEAVMTAMVNPRGNQTTYKFQYGPTKSYGAVAPEEPEEFFVGDKPLEVEEVAEELLPETTYHYRVVAHSDAGTIVGPDQTLTTGPEMPTEEEEGAELHALAKKSWKGFFNLDWSGKREEVSSELNMVEKAGAETFRYAFSDDFAKTNEFFAAAASATHPIRILPDLSFKRMEGKDPVTGTRKGWIEFVEECLKRYGDNGTFWANHPGLPKLVPEYWEIWNEENYGDNGNSNGQVDPPQFAEMLKETHEAFERVDSEAKIMLGGLLTVSKEGQGGGHLSVGGFLHELNNAGGSPYYAAVSLHPYAFRGSVEKVAKHVMRNISKARKALNSVGGQGKPIWVTEIGWPVDGPPGDELHVSVSQEKQKELLETVFDRIKVRSSSKGNGLGIEKAFYYNVQNNYYGDPKDWSMSCGLRKDLFAVHSGGEVKGTPENGDYLKSWYAFQREAESPYLGQFP